MLQVSIFRPPGGTLVRKRATHRETSRISADRTPCTPRRQLRRSTHNSTQALMPYVSPGPSGPEPGGSDPLSSPVWALPQNSAGAPLQASQPSHTALPAPMTCSSMALTDESAETRVRSPATARGALAALPKPWPAPAPAKRVTPIARRSSRRPGRGTACTTPDLHIQPKMDNVQSFNYGE